MISHLTTRRKFCYLNNWRYHCVSFLSFVNDVAAKSYNSNADLYNQVRPSYPQQGANDILSFANIPTTKEETLQAINNGKTYKVMDLAAGSGLFTNVLSKCILEKAHKDAELVQLCAVEPVAGMRRVFSEALPHVPIFDGTSTSLPFPDDHFDLITVAQAFHWFSSQESLTEMYRVLKKDGFGSLALIWNLESAEIEWMRQLRTLYEVYDADVPQYRKGEWERAFDKSNDKANLFELPLIKKRYQTEMLVTQAGIMSRVESKSYITALPEDELQKLKDKMHHLLYDNFGREFNIDVENGDTKGMHARHIIDVELAMTKTTRSTVT